MIKKIVAIMMAGGLMASLTACGSSAGSGTPQTTGAVQETTSAASQTVTGTEAAAEPETDTEAAESADHAGSQALVVYFSWSGNTESVAQEIAAQTGADVFALEPQEPYTDDYNELLDIAQEEQRSNARPAISGSIENLDSYDVIYLGFPNWWGDMPMLLYSFLDDYDLSGKTIAPFVTSGGSGFSNTISAMESLEPDAEILDGLSLGSSEAAEPADAVGSWLEEIGLAE